MPRSWADFPVQVALFLFYLCGEEDYFFFFFQVVMTALSWVFALICVVPDVTVCFLLLAGC